MNCPTCKAEIDSDSIYCDQCGAALMRCPQCGQLRKGKFCPACGKPTVALAAAAPADTAPAQAPQPPQQPIQQPVQPAQPPQQPPRPQPYARPTTSPGYGDSPATSVPPATAATRLVCHAMGITLHLQNGAIIGRKTGAYMSQLGACSYLSRSHARLDFDGVRWTITDLGSTNGTTVNGFPCRPSAPFAKGDTVRLGANYDFIAE